MTTDDKTKRNANAGARHPGLLMYEQARAEAQEKANRTGCHVRLWRNYFREWTWIIVPAPKYQYGRDLEGELVIPEKRSSLPEL